MNLDQDHQNTTTSLSAQDLPYQFQASEKSEKMQENGTNNLKENYTNENELLILENMTPLTLKLVNSICTELALVHHQIVKTNRLEKLKKHHKSINLNPKGQKLDSKFSSASTVSTDCSNENSPILGSSKFDKGLEKTIHWTTETHQIYLDTLNSLVYNGNLEDQILITGLIYLKRLLKVHNLTNVDFLNDLYSICVLLADKFYNEVEYWPASEFAILIDASPEQVKKWEK
jgi:hypothetical protein